MKLNLTKNEKEMIMLTSEGDDTISIYTFGAVLKKRLKSYSTQYSDLCGLGTWSSSSRTWNRNRKYY